MSSLCRRLPRARRRRALLATKSMPGSDENFSRTRASPAFREALPQSRRRRSAGGSPPQAPAGRARGTSQPVLPCVTSSGMPETSVASTGTPNACASISTFGRPSRSPERASREGSTKRSARVEHLEDEGAVLAPVPHDPLGDAELRSPAPSAAPKARPPPTCSKRQSRSSPSKRERT